MDENKASFTAIADRMKLVLGVQTDKDVAIKLGRSPEFVSVRKNRGTIPIAECIMLAIEKNISLDWLILGRGRMELPVEAPVATLNVPKNLAEVEYWDAGDPHQTSENNQAWYLPRAWLKSEGLIAEKTLAVRVVGDAMEPTISAGQTLLVSRKYHEVDGIYFIWITGSLHLRRIQHLMDGSIRLSCDNPKYEAEVVPALSRGHLEILGYCHSVLQSVR